MNIIKDKNNEKLKNKFNSKKFVVTISIIASLFGILLSLLKITDLSKNFWGEAQLVVAPLSDGPNLTPLEGYPVILDNGNKIFTSGVKITLALSHNKIKDHSIAVESITPVVNDYHPVNDNSPEYEIEATSLPPQGFVNPNCFLLEINGHNIESASWIENDGTSIISKNTKNILSTDPPRVLMLNTKDNDIEIIKGTLNTYTSGLYEVSFIIYYLVNGKQHKITTERIHILSNE